jgi:hypothetical protein
LLHDYVFENRLLRRIPGPKRKEAFQEAEGSSEYTSITKLY